MPVSREGQLFLHDGVGLWAEHRTPAPLARRPALFLDRDGVVVEEVDYLGRAEDVVMIAGVSEAIAAANERSVPVVMVTNQSGIARRYYDWHGFRAVQDRIHEELARRGAHFDLVLACGYHEVGDPPLGQPDHAWRKPNPGMLTYAADNYGIDLSRSWIVGDRISDLRAGERAGLVGGTLVMTGYGKKDAENFAEYAARRRPSYAVSIMPNVAQAITERLSH